MWNVIIGCTLILLGFFSFAFFRNQSEKMHKQKKEKKSLQYGYFCMISLLLFFIAGIVSFFVF